MTGDPTFRRENRADAGPVESFVRQADRLDNVANVFAAPFWRRVRHWRLVIGIGRMPLFVAALLALTLVIQMVSGMRDTESRVVFPVVLSAIAPCMIVAGIWPRRWYVLAEESLRPVTRRRFILEQGAAMALEHAATWFYITAATFITALLIGTWTGPGPRLLMAVPVIAGGQVLIFGLIVWELRYRHAWLVIVPMILALSAAGAILVIGGMLAQYRHFGLMLLAGLILAAIGVAITFDAYRRWLTTEFD
jgi:hypothetical protein